MKEATKKPKLLKPQNYRGKCLAKKPINPITGNKFTKDSNGDVCLKLVVKLVKQKKTLQEIKDTLNTYTKKNGKDRNLDAGYLSYLVCSHPEYLRLWSDRVEIVKEFPNPKAKRKSTKTLPKD